MWRKIPRKDIYAKTANAYYSRQIFAFQLNNIGFIFLKPQPC